MNLPEIIEEMRSYADPHSDPWRWADELERAMREPVGEVVDTPYGPGWTVFDLDIPVGTKLYAFPPDVAAEIGRLEAQVDALMLEYCPDDMTPAQIKRWTKQQHPLEMAEAERVGYSIGRFLKKNALNKEPKP